MNIGFPPLARVMGAGIVIGATATTASTGESFVVFIHALTSNIVLFMSIQSSPLPDTINSIGKDEVMVDTVLMFYPLKTIYGSLFMY